MRDIFVTLAVFGSLPIILYRPYIGILMWAWISYMNPHRLTWGFATEFPFAMIIAVTTLIAMLFSREEKRLPWTRETVVLLAFTIWMCITTLFAFHPESAWQELVEVLKIQLMTFVVLMLMKDRFRIDLLVWVIVLSLGFYGIKGGIFTISTGGSYHVMGPQGSFIGDNNELGLALIMTVPLMYYLYLQSKQRWLKWGLIAAMCLTIAAILGTQSRGDLLGLVAMILVLVWKTRKRFILLLLMGPALYGGFLFMPASWHERMNTIQTYQEDDSAMGRINAWHFAFNLAKDRPLVGGGHQSFTPDLFARYAPDPQDVHAAHSVYFQVLGEHGFVGLALFLLLGWFAWRSCSVVVKQVKLYPEGQWVADLTGMLQVSLVGYATSGAFLGLAYFDLYYNVIALIILMKVQSHQLAEQASPSSAARSEENIRHDRQPDAIVGRSAGK